MDSKAYFEKVMQDYNQFRNGRSLRKYCTDEGIDYNWLIKYKKDYPGKHTEEQEPSSPLEFIPISVKDELTMTEFTSPMPTQVLWKLTSVTSHRLPSVKDFVPLHSGMPSIMV